MNHFKPLTIPAKFLDGLEPVTGNEKRKIMYDHIQYLRGEMVFMMGELEKMLQNEQKMKEKEKTLLQVNKKLIDRAQEIKQNFVPPENYKSLMHMMVANQFEYEARLYDERLAPRIRGGFKHECPF
jgi:hypothetical protein